jgi:hypothetical protein
MKPTKKLFLKKEEEEEQIKKSNIDGINLIKVHFMHVVNITMKTLCIINLW